MQTLFNLQIINATHTTNQHMRKNTTFARAKAFYVTAVVRYFYKNRMVEIFIFSSSFSFEHEKGIPHLSVEACDLYLHPDVWTISPQAGGHSLTRIGPVNNLKNK